MISVKIKIVTFKLLNLIVVLLNDFIIKGMKIGIVLYTTFNGLKNIKSKYGLGLIFYLIGFVILFEIVSRIYKKIRLYLFEKYKLESLGIVFDNKFIDSRSVRFMKILFLYFLAAGELYNLLVLYPV